MDETKTLTDERLQAVPAEAELLLTLLTDEDAEGEVEAGQLLLEDVPALCEEVRRLRADVERMRTALEYYADIQLWEKAYVSGGFIDSEADEDMGLVARNALRGE